MLRRFALQTSERIFRTCGIVLRPAWLQRALRRCGVRLPYRYAKHLAYGGLVDFTVADRTLTMQSHNTPIEITIFWKGLFSGREGAELRVWSMLTEHVPAIFDIGANTGVYSLVAAARDRNTVHAFEPVPGVADMLRFNQSQNQLTNVTVHESVVSDTNGTATLYVPSTGWVDVASLKKSFAERHARDQAPEAITVPAVTFDSFITRQSIDDPLLLCKVDVEGAEPQVLQGMTETLAKYRVVLLIEILDETAWHDIWQILPAGYTCLGVVAKAPYVVPTQAYDAAITNYLIFPHAKNDTVSAWLAAA